MAKDKMSFKEYVKSFFTRNFLIMLLVFITATFANKLGTTPITTQSVALGIAGTLLGVLTSMQKVIQMCMRPFSGWIFDHLSEKKMLCIGYVATAVCYFVYGIAQNTAVFAIAKVLQGFSGGLLGGLAYSMLVKSLGMGGFGMAVAVISAISNVFVGYAPKISKSLFENQSFFIAFLVAAIVQLIPAVLCLFLKLEKKNEVENSDKKEAEKTKKRMGMKDYLKGISFAVLPICTLGLFANCTRDLFMTYTVQLGVEQGIDTTIGIAMAAVVTVWIGFVVGFLIDRINSDLVLVVSYCFLGASNLLYGLGSNLTMYNIAAICYQVGIASYWPALQATCFKVAGKSQAGVVSQTLYMFLDFVAIVFASLVGMMYDTLGIVNVYTVMGFVNLFAVVYFLVLKKVYLNKYMEKHAVEE